MKSFLARLFCQHTPVLVGLAKSQSGSHYCMTRTYCCSRCGQVKTFKHFVPRV